MRLTIAPGVANCLKKIGLTDVDTYQSKVGEVGNCCEVFQFPSDQYAVLRGVNPSAEPITGGTSGCDSD